MKRTFSRDYWFLLGSWFIFSVLQLVAAVLSGQAQNLDAFGRFQDPVAAASFLQEALSVLASACSALSGAALGLIALRYWLKPYLLAYLLVLVWQAGTLWPAIIRSSGVGYAGLYLLFLVIISAAVDFGISKGLYLLLKGREWAAALLVVALNAAFRLITLLVNFSNIPAYVEVSLSPSLWNLLGETLLSAASYLLLLFCVHKWWEKEPEALEEKLEEEKEEILESDLEEQHRP